MANDIVIEYIKGSTNTFADILSRILRHNSIQSIDARERNEVAIMKLKFSDKVDLSGKFIRIKDLQEKDPVINELKKKATQIEDAMDRKFAIYNDLVYELDVMDLPKWKIFVPASTDEDIIMTAHRRMGHAGAERVSLTLREQVYIKHLARNARRLIACCELCQKANPINIKYDIDPQAILRSRPNELIAVDTHGPMPTSNFGHKYMFVVYDVISKHIMLYAMRSITTKGCLRKTTHKYIPEYGAPSAILSDNASIFASRRWREPLEERGIRCTIVLHIIQRPIQVREA